MFNNDHDTYSAVGEQLSQYQQENSINEEEEVVEETLEDIEEISEPEVEDVPEEDEAPTSYIIDGEEVSIDQIKEWKNAGLRQSDYTRKTQELASERNRLKDAQTLYDYLKGNPNIVEALRQVETNPNIQRTLPSAEKDALQKMQVELQTLKIDNQIKDLHNRYGDFDENKLFQTATERNIMDLEVVLQSMLYSQGTNKAAIEEAKKQLREELEANKEGTKTTVKKGKPKSQPKKAKYTQQEQRVAEGLGMTIEDYLKWR